MAVTIGASAQDGGLFGKGPQRGYNTYDYNDRGGDSPFFSLPTSHGLETDSEAPLGGGALLLIGFGAAYALKKRKQK